MTFTTPELDQLVEAAVGARKLRAVVPLERRLTRALRAHWRRQKRAVLAAFAPFAERIASAPEVMLTEAVQPDDLQPVLDAIAPGLALAVVIDTGTGRALQTGAAHFAVDLGIGATFDPYWPEVVDYTRVRGAARVAALDDVTRRRLRTLLTRSIDDGLSYTEIARRIAGLFDGFSAPSPLAHVRNRAELVAITEIGEAYEAGAQITAGRLTAQGLILEKRWITSSDERVCAICAPNGTEGWIPLADEFPSGHQRPLGHPGCRCTTERRLRPDTTEEP